MDEDSGTLHHHSQERVTAFWDMVARHYESDPANLPRYGSDAFDGWVSLFEALLPSSPADILDIATGTGFVALIAARLGHRVTGIDLADGMLQVARERATERGLAVKLAHGDTVSPDFPDASFDVITNRFLLWTLREPARALRNWRRLLRPGGLVVSVNVLCAAAAPPDEASGERENAFSRYYTPETRAAIPFMDATDHQVFMSAFEQAGYIGVACRDIPEPLVVEPGRRPFIVTAHRP